MEDLLSSSASTTSISASEVSGGLSTSLGVSIDCVSDSTFEGAPVKVDDMQTDKNSSTTNLQPVPLCWIAALKVVILSSASSAG